MNKMVSLLLFIFSWMVAHPSFGRDVPKDSAYYLNLQELDSTQNKLPQIISNWTRDIDSVKRKLSLNTTQIDILVIDSALNFFNNAQIQIEHLDSLLKSTKVLDYTIRNKQNLIDSIDTTRFKDIDSLKSNDLYFSTDLKDIQEKIKTLLIELQQVVSWTRAKRDELLTKESISPTDKPLREKIFSTVEQNWSKNEASFSYYGITSWNNRIFIILITIAYFFWISRLAKLPSLSNADGALSPGVNIWSAILKTIILFLVLILFSSFRVPLLALQVQYLIVFILLLLFKYRELSLSKRRFLFFILGYYVSFMLVNWLLSGIWWTKVAGAIVNIIGLSFLWMLVFQKDFRNSLGKIGNVSILFISIGYMLALLFLLIGNLPLVRMLGTIASIGILQSLSFIAIKDVLHQDIQRQYESLNVDSWLKRLDINRISKVANILINIGFLYLVVQLIINGLEWVNATEKLFDSFMFDTHSIGKISFSYGNLFLALFVIVLSNWLQKGLKSVFDVPDLSSKHTQKIALLPLFRLIIVVFGFLLGMTILGLGLDKLTVIIGALSVGIGLGLQNIINNFVSGVILVFEKPFKIGDYVELADKKGQVMQIGIRSSTLLTDQGARIIIPNGDLLSGRLVNWTFSDSDIRLNINFLIEKSINIIEWKDWLKNTVVTFPQVDKAIPVKVWTQSITADNYHISLQVGIKNVQLIEKFRSQLLEHVQQEMNKRDIKIATE